MTTAAALSIRTQQALQKAAQTSLERPGKVVRLSKEAWAEMKDQAHLTVEPALRKLLREEAASR
jgi:hypothetical protein